MLRDETATPREGTGTAALGASGLSSASTRTAVLAEVPNMGAPSAWFTTVVVVLIGVVVLQQLGIGLGSLLGTVLHGIEHILGEPIALP